MRYRRSPLAAALALAFLAELVLLFRMELVALVELIPDDSFFYLTLARNFTTSGEFTFDGIHSTYGFQPLWQWCLVPLALVTPPGNPLLYAAVVLTSLLHVVSAWRLYRLLHALAGRRAAVAATAFWLVNPSILRWFWGLKENGLYALLLILALERAYRFLRGETSDRDAVLLGLWIGLAVLARVNFVLLGALLLAGLALAPLNVARAPAWPERWRFVLASAVSAVAVALPWFAWARWEFGSFLPTSGTVKFEQARLFAASLDLEWMSAEYCLRALRTLPGYLDQSLKIGAGLWGPLLVGVGVWVLAERALRACRAAPSRRAAGAGGTHGDPAAAFVVALLLALALVNSLTNVLALPTFLAYGQWYAVPEYLALAVLFGVFVELALAAARSARSRVTLLATVALAALAWSALREQGWRARFRDPRPPGLETHPNRMLLAVGQWAAEHLREDARIGAWDAGIVAYFSGRPIVNLDPLMNSLDYFHQLVRDQLAYTRSERLSYVLGPGRRHEGRFVFDRLPPASYDVLWVPFPDVDLGWDPDEPWFYMLVRPHAAVGPDFLVAADCPFGAWRPDADRD